MSPMGTHHSFHRELAHTELDAASRCTESEEAEVHLTLALSHLLRLRDHNRTKSVEGRSEPHGTPIYHTDKEA